MNPAESHGHATTEHGAPAALPFSDSEWQALQSEDKSAAAAIVLLVAFDCGEEVDLEKARQLAPGAVRALPRRRRTPSSFHYRPPPLHFDLPAITLEVAELGSVRATAGVTLFDFAAVTMALQVPF